MATPNWWDSSWDSVQTGYDGESQTGIWGPGTDLFTPFHATPDNGEEAGAPENTAVIDKYKALPRIGISNIQDTNPNTNMHTAQLADGRTVYITPLANAGYAGGWRPSNRGQPGSTTFESISSQRDIDLTRGDAISADGKYIISTTAPTRTAPPANSDYGFMDFLGEVAPSALAAFVGPQIAGALGSAIPGLSSGAAAAGSGAIVGGGSAALTGGDIGRGALMGGATAAIGNGLFGGSTPSDLSGEVIPEFDYRAGGSNGMYDPSAVSYPVTELAPSIPFTNTVENFGATNTTYPEAVAGTSASTDVPGYSFVEEGQFPNPMEDPYAAGRRRIDTETSIDGGGTFNSGPATFDPNSINADIYNAPPPSGPATFNPNSTVGDPLYGGQGGGVGASVGGGVGAGGNNVLPGFDISKPETWGGTIPGGMAVDAAATGTGMGSTVWGDILKGVGTAATTVGSGIAKAFDSNPLGTIAGGIGIAGSLFGDKGLLTGDSKSAADAATEAANMADPFRSYRAGYAEQLSKLMANPSLAMGTPGYQFARLAGQQGLERAGAKLGQNDSGNRAIALNNYNQNYALSSYDNQIKTLAGLSGATQNPANASSAYLAAQNAQAASDQNMWKSLGQGVGALGTGIQGLRGPAPSPASPTLSYSDQLAMLFNNQNRQAPSGFNGFSGIPTLGDFTEGWV